MLSAALARRFRSVFANDAETDAKSGPCMRATVDEVETRMQDIAETVTRCARWLRESALPLWASRGFDAERGAFEEQLTFSSAPVADAPRRVMVQARQTSVYASAAISGRCPQGAALALRAARAMIGTYLAADGARGWAFSADREGRIVNAKRDLYAHAFVLLGLAWVTRLERDPIFEAATTATLEMLDEAFADPINGGYRDCLPRSGVLRRQNPHMHLLEALIALYETTRRDDILERCRKLHELALARFFDPATGALREYFDDRWAVHPKAGAGSVEPGHLFEWAWLLRRYEAASGQGQSGPVAALIGMAARKGLDAASGRIVDEIGEDGRTRAASSRSWPHAEALKALTEEVARGNLEHSAAIAPILVRLRDIFCRSELNGGWVDHVDAEDRPISKIMPASTLYHVYFAIASVEDSLGSVHVAGEAR